MWAMGNVENDPPPRRGRTLRVLLGTAPGLERFLLATVPAVIVGTVAAFLFGGWIGFGLAMATMAIVVAASRGVVR